MVDTDRLGVPEPGWFWPANSNRAHYMITGRSLCGKWATFGSYGLSTTPDTTPCKECERRVTALEGDNR